MSKSSKYILACGCSFTDENFTSVVVPEYDTSYDKWPALLGDMLDLPVKNIARSGVGNDYIFMKLVADIVKNHENIDLVVVGWTDMQRFVVYDMHFHNPESGLAPNHDLYRSGYHLAAEDYYMYLWEEHVNKSHGNSNQHLWRLSAEALFSRMVALQRLCKSFNIKLLQSSLHGVFNRQKYDHLNARRKDLNIQFDATEGLTAVMSCPSFYEVNPKGVIGWPFIKALGGFEFGSLKILTPEHLINKDVGEWHPNKKGHELIAEYYAREYKKIYL